LGVLYSPDGEEADDATLASNLRCASYPSGEAVFTKPVVWSFLLFVLLYFPCIAAVSAVHREAGRKWAWFTVLYTTAVAWIVSFAVYHILLL
jgi:ferrous iron transport protein B